MLNAQMEEWRKRSVGRMRLCETRGGMLSDEISCVDTWLRVPEWMVERLDSATLMSNHLLRVANDHVKC
jgi:hypothetical protein